VGVEGGRTISRSLAVSYYRRHYLHRLRLPAYAAGKICTVVILGLPMAESVLLRLGQQLVNLYISPFSNLYGFILAIEFGDIYFSVIYLNF